MGSYFAIELDRYVCDGLIPGHMREIVLFLWSLEIKTSSNQLFVFMKYDGCSVVEYLEILFQVKK